ncbi:glycosyltransferase [Paenarthrobacter nitroguajacolicus]|uniref:glycosyltransferase n=1 Tax=Paenarthrobacter nitroguajacolicus TaxID=211146 RepID=UPI00405461C1
MRVLVYPHDLRMGGSQLNAIELGAAMQQMGHTVILFGQPGPLVGRARELGLEFVAAPLPGKRPSPTVIGALVRTIRERRIDIVHGYEWPPALECLAAAKLVRGTTAVATVMSMAVAPFIPKSMPLMVGTEQIRDVETRLGRPRVHLMEPPVDVDFNSLRRDGGTADFRFRWGLDDDVPNVVCVSRLAHELKLEGILSAMDAVRRLARVRPFRLVVAGDGPAAPQVRAAAESVNHGLGWEAVVLTGELADPRPAYAAADVVLGMGGSALRGMSFSKPLVVQGERGFWQLLTPETLPLFSWQGWYGSGASAAGAGSTALTSILGDLLDDGTLRESLGRFGRRLVEERFSLTAAAQRQADLYQIFADTRAHSLEVAQAEAISLLRYSAYIARRRFQRLWGHLPSEDFNNLPVAARTAGKRLVMGTKS